MKIDTLQEQKYKFSKTNLHKLGLVQEGGDSPQIQHLRLSANNQRHEYIYPNRPKIMNYTLSSTPDLPWYDEGATTLSESRQTVLEIAQARKQW